MAHLTSAFRFEQYNSAADAKAALLKLHPVGSSVEDLVNTLEGAGANPYAPFISPKYRSNPDLKSILRFKYIHRTPFSLFPKEWSLSAKYTENNKIEFISIQYYQGE